MSSYDPTLLGTDLGTVQQGSVPQIPMPRMGMPPQQQQPPQAQLSPELMRRQSRQERLDRYQSLITNFTFSLGEGLKASAEARGGARNRTNAGIGAALTAPLYLQQAQEKMKLQQEEMQKREAQTQAILVGMGAQGQRVQNETARTQAGIPLTQAQTVTEQSRPALIGAQIGAAQAQAKRAKLIETPKGLFDIDTRQIIPGTDKLDERIELTSELASKFGLPHQLVGEKLKPTDISSMSRVLQPEERLVTLEDGVYKYNLETGEKVRVGDRPKSAGSELLMSLRELTLQEKTQAAPGQLVSKATGNPVKPTTEETTKIADFETAVRQADKVKGILDQLGETGAIKGYVLENGLYWPIAQDNISPKEAEAVAEVGRMVNAYIYAVSGKQINEQEFARIQRTVPSVRYTKGANQVILKNFRDFVDGQRSTYLNLRGWKIKEEGPTTPIVPRGTSGSGRIIELQTDPRTGLPVVPR